MVPGLRITVVDPDDDYLGVEIQAASSRFAGSARIFAGLDQLSEFAQTISGFPTSATDTRSFEFGSLDSKVAGGYVKVDLRCVNASGHAELAVTIQDDSTYHSKAHGEFTFPIHAAGLDLFVLALRQIEKAAAGEAALASAV